LTGPLNVKKTFAENISRLRKERSLTMEQLGYEIGVGKSAISQWELGEKMPNSGNLEKIANFFNVPKSALFAEGQDRFETYEQSVKLPVYSSIACGEPCMVAENAVSYEVTPKSWLNGGEYFYLIAKGDSMIGARIHEGDLLLIRKQPTVEEGEIAAVIIDDECTLKRVYHHNGTLVLQAENPKYAPIIIKKGDVRIIGKLKKVIIKL
jgi:repressor LexA